MSEELESPLDGFLKNVLESTIDQHKEIQHSQNLKKMKSYNSENYPGKVIIISSSSGGGKSTIVRKLLNKRKEKFKLTYGVSYTTRPKREGEIDGENYFFISQPLFLDSVRNGLFLEWDEYAGNLYGTNRALVDKYLKESFNYITELNTTGAISLKAFYGENCLIIFLLAPYDELKKRLEERGTETPEEIKRRMKETSREIEDLDFFDHVVINEDFDQAYSEVEDIIKEFLNISEDE